jgi:hypothetical protein
VLLLLVRICRHLADEVLLAFGGVSVVHDVSLEMSASHDQLARQSLQEGGLA